MTFAALIPARFKSSRFPGKPLVPLLGKPMIVWVAESVARALGHEHVYVATDDSRIADAVKAHGFKVAMTSERPLTGTDRLWEAAQEIDAEIYLNVQGDEPLLDAEDIRAVLAAKEAHFDEVTNGMTPLSADEDPNNVNIPKVAAAEDGRLIYMSRLAVPGFKAKANAPARYWKQVCIYGFSRRDLEVFARHGRKGKVEQHEDIEILRFLELGIGVRMVETRGSSLAIDVPEDVAVVEAALRARATKG
jgi:3-deoxy-manno-octulosonate cytidylyltransferase (CMP-KDO synthetase)